MLREFLLKRFLEQFYLVFKFYAGMSDFLFLNVFSYFGHNCFTYRKSTETVPPLKNFFGKLVFIQPPRRFTFDIFYNSANRKFGIQAKQNMNMVIQAVDCIDWIDFACCFVADMVEKFLAYLLAKDRITVFSRPN